MAYKVLGQVDIATADTDTTLYTVGAGASAVVSSLVVCNRGTAAATFRIAVRPDGAAIASQHYVYYDVELQGNSTFVFTGGMTMDASDVVTVRASTTDVNFSLFGKEI